MALFETGKQFPPEDSIQRLAKYSRMRKFFKGQQWEVYDRARLLLKDSPQKPQLDVLYIAINLPYILTLKPADLLVGDAPIYEAGKPDSSKEQVTLNKYVEENDLNTLIYESATSNGYRGDSFMKVRYGYRQDYSELTRLGLDVPEDVEMEPIIEHVNASYVFPETSIGDVKKFKAVNIAQIEWVETRNDEIPYLNIERHIPGYIIYERYRLITRPEVGVDNTYGYPITLYTIGDKVATGRDEDIVETGLSHIPVFHIPYSSVDDDWQGDGFIEKIEKALQAVEDRIAQLDFILMKHSDPTLYGPDLEGVGNSVSFGGKYIPITKEDATPGAITWDGQLDYVFKEINFLVSYIFQMSETPQWLFGTTMADGDSGGTGTSHTDGAAIKARFMPILSKVRRIRNHYDKAIRDALYTCYLFDSQFGEYEGESVYPKIMWKDGIPKNEKEEAEIMQIRTSGKSTLDVQSAIKRQDEVDDDKAREIMSRIEDDETAAMGTVDSSIFNQEPTTTPTQEEATK